MKDLINKKMINRLQFSIYIKAEKNPGFFVTGGQLVVNGHGVTRIYTGKGSFSIDDIRFDRLECTPDKKDTKSDGIAVVFNNMLQILSRGIPPRENLLSALDKRAYGEAVRAAVSACREVNNDHLARSIFELNPPVQQQRSQTQPRSVQ